MKISFLRAKNLIIIFLILLSVSVAEGSVTGTQKVLVIPVEFSDVPHTKTIAELQSWMNDQVGSYFSEVSMDQLDLDIQVMNDWVQLGQPLSSYMVGDQLDYIGLAIDALYAADEHCAGIPGDCPGGTEIDWASYSQDVGLAGDLHPVIVVIYSGNTIGRQEGLSLGAGWWWPEGYRYPVPHDMDDGRSDWRVGVAVLSETLQSTLSSDGEMHYESPKGAYAHEMAHAFGGPCLTNAESISRHVPGGMSGIPDLYDGYTDFEEILDIPWIVDTPDDFTGQWALMGAGSINPSPPRYLSGDLCTFSMSDIGQYPSYPTTYTQIRLGWLEDLSQVYRIDPPGLGDGTQSHTVVIRPMEVAFDSCSAPVGIPCARAVKISVDDEDRVYYLVEVRQFTGSDEGLPSEGVIITAVDESRGSSEGIVRVIDSTNPGETIRDCDVDANGESEHLSPLGDAPFNAGQAYEAPDIPGLMINIDSQLPDGSYQVTVTYPEEPLPDVSITDWSPPVYATPDIWIDSQCANGFGVLSEPGTVGNCDPLCFGWENRIYARITNREDVTAHGVVTRFYWAPFGAGQRDDWTFIGEDRGDIAGLDFEDFTVTWRPPDRSVLEETGASHFCIKVDVYSENDRNPSNQEAQENINYMYPESPAKDTFLVTNPTNESKIIYFQVEPRPSIGWKVELYPDGVSQPYLSLGANERKNVTIKITPPEQFSPQMYSVTALTSLGDVLVPIGGVSYGVRRWKAASINLFSPSVNGRSVMVSGQLSPHLRGARIALTYTMPSGKQVVRRVYTDAAGRFVDRIERAQPGNWAVQGVWPGDLAYRRAKSGVVRFRVY